MKGNIGDTRTDLPENIILNHNFSQGLHLWHPNSCDASVVSPESGSTEGVSTKLSGGYARVTNRNQSWQGFEHNITSLVSPGSTYKISAQVGASGTHESSKIQATLRLEYKGSDTKHLSIER